MTNRIERRAFLAACAAVSASAALGTRIAYGQEAGFVSANIQLEPAASGERVLADFMGLSFDASLIPGGAFFHAGNRALIDYVRGLGRGVLQFGGDNLDRTSYAADDLTHLEQFAAAVDWRVILGLSLAGTDFGVADQAAKASQALGERLLAFELGNAPDVRFHDYGTFLSAFRTRATTVAADDPGARFAGPSTAEHPDWASRFAQDERPQLVLLTQQYAHTGGEVSLRNGVHALSKTAAAIDLPYRIEQITSSAGNSLANALWAIDFCFQLAGDGADGVHFHDDADAAPHALYYGLRIFKESADARFVPATVQPLRNNLGVYAVERNDGTRLVTVLNRDANTGVTVNLNAGRQPRGPRVRRLTGLSMETSEVNVVEWRPADISALDVPPASAALIAL